MDDLITELRERSDLVSAGQVPVDWSLVRRVGRRRHAARVAVFASAAMVLTGGGVLISRQTGGPASLTVTTSTRSSAPLPQQSSPAVPPDPPTPSAEISPPPPDATETPVTDLAGRTPAQLAQECQTWSAGVAIPGNDLKLRALTVDSAGAVAALTTDQEASTCEFLPDGTVDTSGGGEGPYGGKNDRRPTYLITPVEEITSGSGVTHRVDNKDRRLVTPYRDVFLARVTSDVAYVDVSFGSFTVRAFSAEGAVVATHVVAGLDRTDITYIAYNSGGHEVSSTAAGRADYAKCPPSTSAGNSAAETCATLLWP